MKISAKGLGIWLFLLAATAGAAADLRLVEAAKSGDKQAARSLLKQHVDVNASQADGATALSWAAYRDDLEATDLLISAGANVNAANDYGAAPLLLACANGSAGMVDRLLKAGANPNAAVSTGETALMRCARTGNVETVKSLLARGANVNAKETGHGDTALMWAVAQKHADIARVLIDHSADVHARTNNGFTPLLLVGGAGGRIKGGRHNRYPDLTPMTNLHLTVLDKLGVPVEKLGDSTGALDLLSV